MLVGRGSVHPAHPYGECPELRQASPGQAEPYQRTHATTQTWTLTD